MGKFDHQLPQETHRQLPQETHRHDHEQTNAFATRDQGRSVSVLARLAAVGKFTPAAVADVIRRYPGELDAILRELYGGPGTNFVQQVISHVHGAMDASRQGGDGAPFATLHHASDTALVADVGVIGRTRPHLHGEEEGATSGRAADPALLADVTCSLAVGDAEPASLGSANPELGEPQLSRRAEYERGVRRGKVALDYLTQIESALMPGFRRSVDALDDAAAREFGILMLGGLRKIEGVEQELQRLMGQTLVLASEPGDAPFNTSSLADEHAGLMEAFDTVAWRLPLVEQMLVERIGPTLFRGDVVMPGTPVLPSGPGALMMLENEAATTIALVATVRTVLEAVPEAQPGRCPLLTEAQRQLIVQEIAPWKGRPVNFAFLKRVLSEYGVWDGIQGARAGAGPSVAEMDAKATENQSRFGAFTDIGDYDEDEAFQRLNPVGQGRGAGDVEATFHTTDTADAKAVFRGLVTASPDGQAKLVIRLSEANKLDVFCEALPWQWVESLAESVHKASGAEGKAAFRLLEPHYVDKGGESMRQYWAELGTPGKVGAFVHDLATAGAMSRMSETQEAHNEGLISDEEFARDEGLTAATSIGITALTGMFGQLGGTVGGKLAARFGAGEVGQFFGASISGGVAGSVGGHLSGDVLAQLFEGKEGFDSLGSYVESAGIGAGVGFAAASVSFGVARYLPPSEQSWAHRLAAQHPEEARTIEALATGSPGSRIRIRVPRRRAVKLGELGVIDAGAGLPVPAMVGPPPSQALADVAEPDILLDLELTGQLAGGTPLAHVIQSRMLGADEQGFEIPIADHGGGGGPLGAGDRSVLGEGAEVDALYAEEPIPEPSRLPAEEEGMGWWEGQRGNSNWWPDKPAVQAITRGKPIRFVNGEPDFSPWSKGEVKILGGKMTGGRADMDEADRIFAMRNPKKFPDANAVELYRRTNELTWHHKMDMETLQLVPTELNHGNNTPHIGGASLARRQP